MNFEVSPLRTGHDVPLREKRFARLSALKYLIGIGALMAVLGGFYYYTHMGTDAGARGRGGAAPVTIALAERRDMPVIERTIGTVVANSSVSVTARVQGQLVKADFKEGQIVKAGDLLFEIDPRPYQAALNQAAGQMARDAAAFGSAQADARRYASLFTQNAISTQQRDQSLATAEADKALVESDKAAVETARLNLEFCQIRSPVNGKTGPILLQPGNLVSVNGTTTPLVMITQIQPVKVSFALPQADLPRIQARAKGKGLTAQVDLHDVGGGDNLSAPVDFISNAVNATSGTIELRATFPNLDSGLVPGQLVDVVVELSEIPDAIVVPRDAVNSGQDAQFVYVVTPDRVAEMRAIKLLYDDGTNAAIQGDVHDGDKVIVDGQLRVVPGAKVSFVKPAGAAKAGKGARRGRRGGGGQERGQAGSGPAPG